MDLSAYPNLAAIGLMKERALNKRIYANLQDNLSKISDEEFRRIDSEVASAENSGGMLIMPTAIIKLEGIGKKKQIMDICLCKDIIYIWGATFTMKMNFIPYNKMHTVHILLRDGKALSSDTINTGGFSKKDITGPIIEQIKNTIDSHYPGILYGWTKERETAMNKDFDALVKVVDKARGTDKPEEQPKPEER